MRFYLWTAVLVGALIGSTIGVLLGDALWRMMH